MKINIYDTRIDGLKTILVKEKEIAYGNDEIEIHNPQQIVAMMNEAFELNKLAEEHCYIIATNTKGSILGVFFISKGTVNSSIVGIREIFLRLFLCGAVNFIVCHNHPSKGLTPSIDDNELTKRLKEAGKLLQIHLLDHIIIGGDDYFSFQENEIL